MNVAAVDSGTMTECSMLCRAKNWRFMFLPHPLVCFKGSETAQVESIMHSTATGEANQRLRRFAVVGNIL